MCGGFAEGSGDEASGDEVEQEDGDERGGESEQEPVHVFVRVEEGKQHQHPEACGDHRDADGDEHGAGEAGKIPRELIVDGAAGVPARFDLDG